jgi:hypothetical protein
MLEKSTIEYKGYLHLLPELEKKTGLQICKTNIVIYYNLKVWKRTNNQKYQTN